MKYFVLNNSTDILEIGSYPQIEKSETYDYGSPSSFWNVKWDKSPDFVPSYEAQLSEGATATNLLEKLPGFYGLCIDQKLKDLIVQQNLPPHNFFSVEISKNRIPLNYYWFHFTESLLPFVDFQNTVFETFRKNKFSILKEFSVSNIDELNQRKDQLNFEVGIRVKSIKLNSSFPMYDVISLWGIIPVFLISGRLKDSIEQLNITGVEVTEFDKIN